MSRPAWFLRFLALLVLSTWIGGFSFYGGAVVPILHEQFGSFEGAFVTRRVTDVLNLVGLVSLFFWWILAVVERRRTPVRAWRLRWAALVVSTATLAFLVALHRVMDARIDADAMAGFTRLHRAYLLTSTAQWVANLVLIAASLPLWSSEAAVPSSNC